MTEMRGARIASHSRYKSLFRPRHNCWQITKSDYIAPVIDCDNYYRALHESISKAQRSIFIVGWDIDSRIELIRDGDKQSDQPKTLFDLLKWKAHQNPHLHIYLNRWNYSLFLAGERETFSTFRWKFSGIKNLHFIFDDQIPLGASHHQKIVVVDDEIAFSGGMDVAIARWDKRTHHIQEESRLDPDGTLLLGRDLRYKPYHDVQVLVCGETARSLASLVRKRWLLATGEYPIPQASPTGTKKLPLSWPQSIIPKLHNASVGISRTQPAFRDQKQIREIETLYIDMIRHAQGFIYMENQFLTHRGIARALNAQLVAKPSLRLLILSCKDPQGIMERKAMYQGRVLFRDVLEANGVADRIVIAYPISEGNGVTEQIRIHSKVMIVDDMFLRIGSSNLNYRSMGLDTECDLVIEGKDQKTRLEIANIRNDLIREHTGRTMNEIEEIIAEGKPVSQFLKDKKGSRQHLRPINDEEYRHEWFAGIAKRFADSSKPLLPGYVTAHRRIKRHHLSFPIKKVPFKLIITLLLILLLALSWKFTPLSEYADANKLLPFFESIRSSEWAFVAGLLIYVLGTLLFFPHIVMTTAVIMVFSPVESFFIAIIGSLISFTFSYFLGSFLGEESLKAMFGKYAEKIRHYADKGGVTGLTILRLLPTAPFTAENLILGMMKVSYLTLLLATFLGMLPGTLLFVFLGESATELLKHPDPEKVGMVGIGLIAWCFLIWGTHIGIKRWQTHKAS